MARYISQYKTSHDTDQELRGLSLLTLVTALLTVIFFVGDKLGWKFVTLFPNWGATFLTILIFVLIALVLWLAGEHL